MCQINSINTFTSYLFKIHFNLADQSGRAVWGMNRLRPLEHWDRGFGSHSGHGCLYCVCLFCVCVVLCVSSGLATGWSLFHGILPTVYRLRIWKRAQGSKGCSAIQREIEHFNIMFSSTSRTVVLNGGHMAHQRAMSYFRGATGKSRKNGGPWKLLGGPRKFHF
jgi:hypothetical protein